MKRRLLRLARAALDVHSPSAHLLGDASRCWCGAGPMTIQLPDGRVLRRTIPLHRRLAMGVR